MHSATELSEAICRCVPRRPACRNALPIVIQNLPIRPLRSGAGRVTCDNPPRTTKGGPSRLGIVLRWPIGIALVSWRYMWRTTPLHRSEDQGDRSDMPADAGDDGEDMDGRQP